MHAHPPTVTVCLRGVGGGGDCARLLCGFLFLFRRSSVMLGQSHHHKRCQRRMRMADSHAVRWHFSQPYPPPPPPLSCHNCASVRAPCTVDGATLARIYLLVTTEVGVSLYGIARRGGPRTPTLPPRVPNPVCPPLLCGRLATHSISRARRVHSMMTSRGRQGSRQVDPVLCSVHLAKR